MAVALQGSLLGLGTDGRPGELGPSVQRSVLTDGAWVDVRRSWIAGDSVLFDRLSAAADWHAERRRMYDRVVDVPRLVAFYGEDDAPPDSAVGQMKELLDAHYGDEAGELFGTVGLCLYRDGRDSVAWHGDTIGRGATADTMVAIVSIGAPRRFLLRPRGGGTALRYDLGLGDLLVMGGSCQRTWEHCIPKRSQAGPRMSLQFRPHGVR